MRKPIASLSLDLDNLWTYLKTNGDPAWRSFPGYLDEVVPRILGVLDRHGLKITFFIVGQDAALQVHGVGTTPQHLLVMIGLQHHQV